MRDGVDYADLGADYFDTHAWIRAARPLVSLSSYRRSATGSLSNTSPETIFE
jgi:hypothetical protein